MNVELLESMGSDLSVVNAARVSYARSSESLTASDVGLISYLMKNRHGTPFEMIQFKFRVRVPVCVAREWQRHRIGSFNEVSTRYVEMPPEFYTPSHAALRTQVGKPGHYTFEPITDPVSQRVILDRFTRAYESAYRYYEELLVLGVAKELARNVLPLGLYTEFVWSVNLRSLLNFLELRTGETALLEIREAAKLVETLANTVAPEVMKAWNQHGRRAP